MAGYNFEVVIEDGVGRVIHITPGMADGVWSVGGTDDQWGASINVTHKRPTGQYVAEAQHAYNPENYKAPEIPGLDNLKMAFISMGFSPAEAERHAMESLGRLPSGVKAPEPPVQMPPGLNVPAASPPHPSVSGFKGVTPSGGDNNGDDNIPPGAKPFRFEDTSTWPKELRRSHGIAIGPDDAPEGSPEPPLVRGPYTSEDDATGRPFRDDPRMRGDIHD